MVAASASRYIGLLAVVVLAAAGCGTSFAASPTIATTQACLRKAGMHVTRDHSDPLLPGDTLDIAFQSNDIFIGFEHSSAAAKLLRGIIDKVGESFGTHGLSVLRGNVVYYSNGTRLIRTQSAAVDACL